MAREISKNELAKLRTWLRAAREADPTIQAINIKPHLFEALINMASKVAK